MKHESKAGIFIMTSVFLIAFLLFLLSTNYYGVLSVFSDDTTLDLFDVYENKYNCYYEFVSVGDFCKFIDYKNLQEKYLISFRVKYLFFLLVVLFSYGGLVTLGILPLIFKKIFHKILQ
jgi:hypothetical protein